MSQCGKGIEAMSAAGPASDPAGTVQPAGRGAPAPVPGPQAHRAKRAVFEWIEGARVGLTPHSVTVPWSTMRVPM